MSRCRLSLSFALLLAVGCGASNPPRDADQKAGPDRAQPKPAVQVAGATQPGEGAVNVNGVVFELPWRVDAIEALKAVGPKGITFRKGDRTVEVANGRVKLNGKDYGPVNAGDRVTLTEAGVLSVNGEQRKAKDNPP